MEHVFLLKLNVGEAEAIIHIQLIFIIELEFT